MMMMMMMMMVMKSFLPLHSNLLEPEGHWLWLLSAGRINHEKLSLDILSSDTVTVSTVWCPFRPSYLCQPQKDWRALRPALEVIKMAHTSVRLNVCYVIEPGRRTWPDRVYTSSHTQIFLVVKPEGAKGNICPMPCNEEGPTEVLCGISLSVGQTMEGPCIIIKLFIFNWQSWLDTFILLLYSEAFKA